MKQWGNKYIITSIITSGLGPFFGSSVVTISAFWLEMCTSGEVFFVDDVSLEKSVDDSEPSSMKQKTGPRLVPLLY